MPALRLATRGSQLARVQTEEVATAVRRVAPGLSVQFVEVSTTGDERQEPPLASLAGGAFVKEVDARVLDSSADLAVHSCKDMPTTMPRGLVLTALLPRGPTHDALVGPAPLEDLPRGAVVGTSSPRRAAQVRRVRPDLRTIPLRGNVPSRVAKVGRDIHAALLAEAGLARLGLTALRHPLPVDRFPTSPGQGAIAVVARRGTLAAQLAARLDHAPTRAAVEVERAVLHELGTGCATPMGCTAWWEGHRLRVSAQLLAPDGGGAVTLLAPAEPHEIPGLGRALGRQLAQRGRGLLARP